jgi:hypothetical protein
MVVIQKLEEATGRLKGRKAPFGKVVFVQWVLFIVLFLALESWVTNQKN